MDIPEAQPPISAHSQAEGSPPYTGSLLQPIIAILMMKKYTDEFTLINEVLLFVNIFSMSNS